MFHRREITLELEADITPSKVDALKMVVEQTKSSEDLIVVKNVLGQFGSQVFKIVAFVYDSVEVKNKIEPKKKVKK